jgi:hypothetical protein
MRRNILIFLGFLTALLPYLGFPYDINKWIWTVSGFTIVFFLVVPLRRKKMLSQEYAVDANAGMEPRSLHVERREVGDRAGVHIERETVTDVERRIDTAQSDVIVEKQVTVTRRRKQKMTERIPSSFEPMIEEDNE